MSGGDAHRAEVVNAPKDIPEVSGVTRNHIDLIAAETGLHPRRAAS
jgi:hypothetical protein